MRARFWLLSVLALGCQVVAGYDDFSGGDGAPTRVPVPPPCQGLPLAKSDENDLTVMVRVDVAGGTCFWMDQTEVTVAQYDRWLTRQSSEEITWDQRWCAWKTARSDPAADASDSCRAMLHPSDVLPFEAPKPMRCVDFCDARAFCSWAGKRLCYDGAVNRVGDPKGVPREWLIACTNQLTTRYAWGNEVDEGRCNTASRDGVCLNDIGLCGALPVGQEPACASRSGAEDLLGNVAEWVFACNYPSDAALEPSRCLARGGGYDQPLGACDQEDLISNDSRRPNLGFRCCDDLTPAEKALVASPATE